MKLFIIITIISLILSTIFTYQGSKFNSNNMKIKKSTILWVSLVILLNSPLFFIDLESTSLTIMLLLTWLFISDVCLIMGLLFYGIWKFGAWLDAKKPYSNSDNEFIEHY